MLFLTKWFGVTGTYAERDLAAEPAIIDGIVERILAMQTSVAAEQRRPVARGTHAKGVCTRAQFDIMDVTAGRDRALAARLAEGIYSKPGIYPAVVRFANSDPHVNSDFKGDVRALSFSVELASDGANPTRHDYSMQSATTLPVNGATALLAVMKVLTASSPAIGAWSLSFRDKLRFVRSMLLVQSQIRRPIRPYQQLRYWSNVPFHHGGGCREVLRDAKPRQSRTRSAEGQSKCPAGGADPDLNDDTQMSCFDFELQFLDTKRMAYLGRRRDASFWIENASIEWNETQAPFHTVARLTLLPK